MSTFKLTLTVEEALALVEAIDSQIKQLNESRAILEDAQMLTSLMESSINEKISNLRDVREGIADWLDEGLASEADGEHRDRYEGNCD